MDAASASLTLSRVVGTIAALHSDYTWSNMICKNCRRATRKGTVNGGPGDVHEDGTRYCRPGSRAYECEPVPLDTELPKDTRPQYVYVASSWRNMMQEAVVHTLAAVGIDCYDFKNPTTPTCVNPDCAKFGGDPLGRGPRGDDCGMCQTPLGEKQVNGFHWGEVMEGFDRERQLVPREQYLKGLQHERSVAGFKSDFDAMNRADAFVLILPCGRSAHLELGWAIGAGKRTAILLDGEGPDKLVTPELMYLAADHISPDMFDLLGWLGVQD